VSLGCGSMVPERGRKRLREPVSTRRRARTISTRGSEPTREGACVLHLAL
jgi:hypothetical protein